VVIVTAPPWVLVASNALIVAPAGKVSLSLAENGVFRPLDESTRTLPSALYASLPALGWTPNDCWAGGAA